MTNEESDFANQIANSNKTGFLQQFHEFSVYTDEVLFEFSGFKVDDEVIWIGKPNPINEEEIGVHPAKGIYWMAELVENSFDSYGCSPTVFIKQYKKWNSSRKLQKTLRGFLSRFCTLLFFHDISGEKEKK